MNKCKCAEKEVLDSSLTSIELKNKGEVFDNDDIDIEINLSKFISILNESIDELDINKDNLLIDTY